MVKLKMRDPFNMDKQHQINTGAYFTPPIIVNDCHKNLDSILGSTWKQDYVVWECSAEFPERYKEFIKKYRLFRDRLVPLVYELGFLRESL